MTISNIGDFFGVVHVGAIVAEYISFLIREVTGPSGVVTQEECECTRKMI